MYSTKSAPPLRFVEKDGKKILQYLLEVHKFDYKDDRSRITGRWVDVPLFKEEDTKEGEEE